MRCLCIWRDPRLAAQPRQTGTGCQPWGSLSPSASTSGPVTRAHHLATLPGCLSPKISPSCARQVNHSRAKSSPGQNAWELGESWNCDHEHPMASHFPGEEITRAAPWRCEHLQAALSAPCPAEAKPWAVFHRSCFPALCPLSPWDMEAPATPLLCRLEKPPGVQPGRVQAPHVQPSPTPRAPAVSLSLGSSSSPQWELTAARPLQPWPCHLRALLVLSQRTDSHFECAAEHSLTSAPPVRSPSMDTCWLAQ